VTPGCWPKLPPIMIIRRRLTCYNSLWDEFPLNAHLLTIHLAAANLYTYIKGAHIEMGLAAAAALHLSRLPRLRAEIDFEARVQFTIGLNSRIAYCDAGRNFKRNAAELIFGDEIEIAVFGFSAAELKKRTHFFTTAARALTNDSATCVLIMAMKIRRHELFIGQE
jgi:hypothetical protein